MEHDVQTPVGQALRTARDRVVARLDGLTDEEYLWEPVPGCWTITWSAEGWRASNDPEADPAPFTTIAWRLWHLSIDCFESYSERAFGSRATGLPDDRFVGSAIEATTLLRRTTDHFLAGFDGLGNALWQPLGPAFGPFANATNVDLALHALGELTHHGAEIGVIRDLFAHHDLTEAP